MSTEYGTAERSRLATEAFEAWRANGSRGPKPPSPKRGETVMQYRQRLDQWGRRHPLAAKELRVDGVKVQPCE